jgi:triosephosphate isomerase
MRVPIITANWKMHKTSAEAVAFAEKLAPQVSDLSGVEAVIAPPFPALAALAAALRGGPVALAAQNVHPEPQGAFTGEVSVGMIAELGCRYAIVGHSERRQLFGESSAFVAQKVVALQAAGLVPIVCVGEQLDEREAGRTSDVVGTQLAQSLDGATPELVIAYEPVWAIGTGLTATPDLAQEVHGFVRERLVGQFGADANAIRIQYGGSVKPENAAVLLAEPDIDGALVGGASLDPESFSAIIRSYPHPEGDPA